MAETDSKIVERKKEHNSIQKLKYETPSTEQEHNERFNAILANSTSYPSKEKPGVRHKRTRMSIKPIQVIGERARARTDIHLEDSWKTNQGIQGK